MKKTMIEKILWVIMILMFIGSVFGDFLSKYIAAGSFYKLSIEITVIAAIILSLERYLFSSSLNREVTFYFNLTYWLIIAYSVMLILQYVGVLNCGFLVDDSRTLWMVVPAATLLWMTRFIFGDSVEGNKKGKK